MNKLIPITIIILISTLVIYPLFVKRTKVLKCLVAPVNLYSKDPLDGMLGHIPEPITGNSVQFLVNGNDILPKMLDIINIAKENILWHVMLFAPDEAGFLLSEALINAAKRGVVVQLAFDVDQSVNSTFFAPYPQEKKERFNAAMVQMLGEMEEAGITILDSVYKNTPITAQLSPDVRRIYATYQESICVRWNHYDHRKILVVDNSSAIVGGMNVGNEYLYLIPPDLTKDAKQEVKSSVLLGEDEAWEKWQDSAIFVQGPIALNLAKEFNILWEILGGTPIQEEIYPGDYHNGIDIQLLRQSPADKEISTAMVNLFDNAENDIYLAYPYVSHHVLLEHLREASLRGVEVHFFFPGDYNDISISKRYLRLFSGELISAGVKLYENNKRMNHTKLMVVDGRFVIIGSHNFNYRSVNHDQELNLLVDDHKIASDVIERLFIPYIIQSNQLFEPYNLRWNFIDTIILPFS